MALKTPPLHTKGIFTLNAPWSAPSDVLFECIAIRSFADFILKGEDVFSKFYQPQGLDETTYQNDLLAGAHIVTLKSETSSMIFVPDTYIASFPDVSGVPYKRIVVSALLAPLPDDVDLTHLQASVATLVSDITGVVGTVNIHSAPYSGVVTSQEHATFEMARQAAINNRTIDRARLLEQQDIIDAQAVTITELQNEIIRLKAIVGP